jgi:hypothetical protein
MEETPRLDASRPGGLRFAGFMIAVAATLLVGVGSIQTWVTVGVNLETNTNTPIPGVDLVDGKITLACAVVLLLALLGGRLVRGRSVRMGLAALTITAAMIAAVIAAAFLQNGLDRQVVLDAIGIPRDQWAANDVFREFGVGVYLVLAGGVLGFFAGILTLAWAQRLPAATSDAA